MVKITIDKKEYTELIRLKDILERILKAKKEKKPSKKDGFLRAFGVLKEIKRNSLDYITNLRKEWRGERNI